MTIPVRQLRQWKIVCWPICLVALSCLLAARGQAADEKKEAPQYSVAGRDPKAYPDAAALFASPPLKLLDDQTAAGILAELDRALQGDFSPAKLWVPLDRLRGTRMSGSLTAQLRQLSQKLKLPAGSKLPSDAVWQAFQQGNLHYEAGRFDKAVESYRSAIQSHPAFWDAWNNMALAEMHANHDLVALFEFAALNRNAPRHTGAVINLAVCLERLGSSGAAYALTAAAVRENSNVPMARYNQAWFENSRGNYDAAQDNLARVLSSAPDYALAQWLRTINAMEAGRPVTFEALQTLPAADRANGIPKSTIQFVKVSMADACDGDTVAGRIPKATSLVVSEKSGDWTAVYRPVNNVKRRLWILQADLSARAPFAWPVRKPVFYTAVAILAVLLFLWWLGKRGR